MVAMTVAGHPWWVRVGAGLGALMVAFALLVVPASPAAAHAVLVSSSPVANAVVPAAPAEVVLTFSEPVRKVPGRIRVIAPDGSRVDRGEPSFEGSVVTIEVDPSGPRGTYLVSYRVISADSHPLPGAYTYSVGAPSAPPTDSGGDGGDRVNTVVDRAVKVVKYLSYTGLLLLVGPVLVLSLLWPRRLSRTGAIRLAWTGYAVLVVATIGAIVLQAPYTAGGGLLDVTGSGIRDVLGSSYGAAHLVRLGLLAAGAFLLWPVLAGTGGRSDRMILAVLGAALLFTWPVAGHPAVSPAPAVSVVVDAVHLGGMAVWIGGLAMLGGFLLRLADDRELGAIMPIWSRWAAFAVGALVLAGTVGALIEVGSVEALLDTTYGRLLLAKLGLFVVAMVGAVVARQMLHRQEPARRPARRAVWVELAVAAVVLGVSATLVQTTPARTAVTDVAGIEATYYSASMTSSLYNLQMEMDPAERGNNTIHVYAYTPDNKPLPVLEWSATAALPAEGIEPLEIPLLPLTDNHATGEINLPTAGEWQFRFTLRISDIDQATVTTTVPVK
ncbi:copper resistance CopC/CopD family protein [Micromonospora echinofusca]|uniref:Copper resistance protein CopC n=1 Tax=Micromonospora echinofusca TaxID=47858 RepID=A0ABS3VXN9_MICEH|nr:copper resistance protein CopC [Micromonospora echinofusca]MBO4209231.1 copper resistance protein CopC [Micromonospora echinofusca]